MHRAHRYFASLFLAAAIAAPLSVVAAAPQDASVQVRVYDKDHRDYHNWDDREDRAYRGFLTERRETYREYNRQYHKNAESVLELAPRASRSRLALATR
jgi:hypothetical protein